MVVVAMNDGRVLNGLVRARTDRTLTLQTQTAVRSSSIAVRSRTKSPLPVR